MTNRSGYYDLLAIVEANQAEARANEAAGIPGTGGMVGCPNCGARLNYNDKRGLWACEMGDYTTTSGPGRARR